jgi:hypothetical protein
MIKNEDAAVLTYSDVIGIDEASPALIRRNPDGFDVFQLKLLFGGTGTHS